MIPDNKWILIGILLGLAALPCATGAAITTISPGGTVFLGEQALDITLAMDGDTQIGWWASAASIADSAPTYIVSISNPASFSVTPSILNSQTGSWYRLNPSKQANGTAFIVMDPNLAVRIEDTSVGVDVTDKWVPTDDEIRFRIDTNLVAIGQRSGVSSVPITIKVQDPSGATYTSLINSAGTSTSIVDIPVSTTPYFTASIWDTGQRTAYRPGTYTIWAECNVNSMKDNYNQAGKTVSQKVTLQNQDHNPLITGNYPATTTTSGVVTSVPTTPTKVPISVPATSRDTATTVLTTQSQVAPVVTTTEETSPPPTTKATKSPGFEGIVLIISLACCVLVLRWKM